MTFTMQLGLQIEKMVKELFEEIGYGRASLDGAALFDLVPPSVVEQNQAARVAKGKSPMNWARHKHNDVAVLDHFYKVDYAFKVANSLLGLQLTINSQAVPKKLAVLETIHRSGLHRKAGFDTVGLVLVHPGPKSIEGKGFLSDEDIQTIKDRLFDLIDGLCDAQEAGRPLPTLMLVLP